MADSEILEKNVRSSNNTGSRPLRSYSNPLDQMRYIYALRYSKEAVILDIACGVGWGSFLMANRGKNKIYGVDVSQNAIRLASKYYSLENIEYHCYDGHKLPFADDTFDLIVSFETLEHVEDPVSFINELHRVSKNKSTLLLSTPNSIATKLTSTGKPWNPFHLEEYDKNTIEQMLKFNWEVDNYLGQCPILKKSKELTSYRKFVKNYWHLQSLRNQNILTRIYAWLLSKILLSEDPTIVEDCYPQVIDDAHEPVCHFFICQSKK